MPWGYASSKDAEGWEGYCDSREEAIEEGREYFDGEAFYICEGYCPDPADFIDDGSDVIERMDERCFDECGDIAEDWPSVPDAALKELNDFLEAWARKHCHIDFYMCDGEKAELIPAEETTNEQAETADPSTAPNPKAAS